jgi:hypothetical protein
MLSSKHLIQDCQSRVVWMLFPDRMQITDGEAFDHPHRDRQSYVIEK